MRTVSAEQLVEKLEVDVYPITLVKFLLNKRRIMYYFNKAAETDFELRGMKYQVNHSNCKVCKEKEEEGVQCREHTSITRVLTARTVLFDLDTKAFFFKNEIFRMVGQRLVIVYCPHPRLIVGPVIDAKVRRIRPITIQDPELEELPKYNLIQILTSDLMDQNIKCWFNKDFSIVTVPNDRNYSNWCLVANR